MNDPSNQEQAVELLQELGLKEYEAKSFVALSRLPRATAKEISEISEVPRTRIYDAVRVLETKGLVEIQHSSPQQFRAVSIDEAVDTLQNEYVSRGESLRETLQGLDPAPRDGGTEVTHEVWAMSGATAISNRTLQLIDEATEEIILVIGDDEVYGDQLADRLVAAEDRGVDVLVGTTDETLYERVHEELPDAAVFVSGLEWMSGSLLDGDDTEISRMLLVDRSTILVSSFHEDNSIGEFDEQAVFGRGFDNGLVAIVRRLMATGLLHSKDPASGHT